jgi:GMP reductase
MRRFDFRDINLIPRKCIVASRSMCDTSKRFGYHMFKLPIVPANMECVINKPIAKKLASEGYFYIYHRFQNDTIEFIQEMKRDDLISSISLGVNADAYKLVEEMKQKDAIPDYITIDIAHGHSEKMESILKFLRKEFPNDEKRPYIIAGNVSTPEAVVDLEEWGADCIKAGVGPGMACTTYMMTGYGSRNTQAAVVQACAKAKRKPETTIIADGGITEPGDIAKALVMGADMVMIGGMFSGLTDSPGNLVTGVDGKQYKEFWGSASVFQSGKQNRIEGTKKLIPAKNHGILQEMHYLGECLQSAISYGGGNSLECFKEVKYF